MLRFHDYGDMEKQIHVPEALKERVLQAARDAEKPTLRLETAPKTTARHKAGRYSRGFSLAQKAAVIAILLVCIPVTAYAAVKSSWLVEHLKKIGMENREIAELVETYPSEAAVTPTVSDSAVEASITPPEFSVAEAVCDDHSLYLTVRISPKDDRYLLVPGELGINEDVGNMQIPGVSGRTIEEYAKELGKEILLVSAWPDNRNKYGVSAGVLSECDADGTVYQYYTGDNPSEQKEFPLAMNCHYMTGDQTIDERFSFDVTIKNKSTASNVREYTRFADTGLGLQIHSLTIEETEMGYYAKFNYSITDGNDYRLTLVDADGNFMLGIPGSGYAFNEKNEDGTYTCEDDFRKEYSMEGVQIMVDWATEASIDNIGPFAILG